MEDRLVPMEAEVLEMPPKPERSSRRAAPADTYGTATPQRPKKSRVGLLVFLGLTVILFCSVSVLVTIFRVRVYRDDGGSWHLSMTSLSPAAEQPSQPERKTLLISDKLPDTVPGEDTLERADLALGDVRDAAALSAADLYERVSPSVVCLEVSTYYSTSAYTGVVISESGYILAATDGLTGALTLTVTLADGTACPATRVGESAETGVCLLKIDAEGLTPADFAPAAEMRVGERVYCISNPYGSTLRNVLTDGLLSLCQQTVLGSSVFTLVQTTASGGGPGTPIFNGSGQVIALTSCVGQKLLSSGSDPGFGIGAENLQTIVTALLAQAEARSCTLGLEVEEIPEEYLYFFDYPGTLWITTIRTGSAGDGVLSACDVITAVDGEPVTTEEEFYQAVSRHAAGERVQLTIYRSGNWYLATLPVG